MGEFDSKVKDKIPSPKGLHWSCMAENIVTSHEIFANAKSKNRTK